MRDSPTAEVRLSHLLRQATSAVHRETEIALDLPRSVRTGSDYCNLLECFYRLYAPLEERLGQFQGWPEIGLAVPEPVHSEWLARDLRALGTEPESLPWAGEEYLPRLPGFAHALGAMYVIAGSTLGSQVVLRLLKEAVGPAMIGADTFLLGYGAATRDRWARFCVVLDRFGEQEPGKLEEVIEGAHSAFAAVGSWMAAGMRGATDSNMQLKTGSQPQSAAGLAERAGCPWARSDMAL